MRERFVLKFFIVCFACVLSITPYGLAEAQTTLKAVTAWPKTASEYKAFTVFADLVEQMVAKKYPGELKIDRKSVV